MNTVVTAALGGPDRQNHNPRSDITLRYEISIASRRLSLGLGCLVFVTACSPGSSGGGSAGASGGAGGATGTGSGNAGVGGTGGSAAGNDGRGGSVQAGTGGAAGAAGAAGTSGGAGAGGGPGAGGGAGDAGARHGRRCCAAGRGARRRCRWRRRTGHGRRGRRGRLRRRRLPWSHRHDADARVVRGALQQNPGIVDARWQLKARNGYINEWANPNSDFGEMIESPCANERTPITSS